MHFNEHSDSTDDYKFTDSEDSLTENFDGFCPVCEQIVPDGLYCDGTSCPVYVG